MSRIITRIKYIFDGYRWQTEPMVIESEKYIGLINKNFSYEIVSLDSSVVREEGQSLTFIGAQRKLRFLFSELGVPIHYEARQL